MPRLRKPGAYRWRAGFFSALAQSGNVKLACEKAQADRPFVYKIRKRDQGFAAQWDAALAAARAGLADGSIRPAGAWAGDRMVLRRGERTMPILFRPRAKTWSRHAEAIFLKTLASTANVTAAAVACGFSRTCLYRMKRTNRTFADAWDEALENGMADLEFRLVNELSQPPDPDAVVPDSIMPIERADIAISLLQMHRRNCEKPPLTKPKDLDELRDSIMRKVRAIRRAWGESGKTCPTCGRDYASDEPAFETPPAGDMHASGEARERPNHRIRNLWG